jgi:hypothetical protein
MPLLVRSTTNEESANKLPVPMISFMESIV